MSEVIERFLRYVKVDTQSDESSDGFPSTDKQKNLAIRLAQELKDLGITDVTYDDNYGYVYAIIDATEDWQGEKTLGFIAHMDTSPEVSGANVKPQIIENYDGRDIVLGNDAKGQEIIMSTADFPELKSFKGKSLITTDGTTLLGADDKAGVSEIMSMASYIMSHKDVRHGRLAIAFTPDEEVGGGMDHFDVKAFGADYAYTVDGGTLGEIEYENFNAASVVIDITGRNVHPGDAKDKMKNAALMAMELESQLPMNQKPEYTSGYEGFYHLLHMEGCVENAHVEYIIRDHDREKFEKKKSLFNNIVDQLNKKYGAGSFNITMKDQYYNMKEKIEPYMFLVDNVVEVMKELEVEPVIQPIRGGTDGARLSYMGVPCPNLCTGGHNYHSRYEYACVESMEKVTEILIRLACKEQ